MSNYWNIALRTIYLHLKGKTILWPMKIEIYFYLIVTNIIFRKKLKTKPTVQKTKINIIFIEHHFLSGLIFSLYLSLYREKSIAWMWIFFFYPLNVFLSPLLDPSWLSLLLDLSFFLFFQFFFSSLLCLSGERNSRIDH